MSSEFAAIRVKDKIEIAISTETILYIPFYIAYYNNDFSDTFFCDLEVNIIGTTQDLRFNHNENIKGDGFATFAVLIGLADAAICDPSYLVYLNYCDDEVLKKELYDFQILLVLTTKKDIEKSEDFKEYFELDHDNNLVFKNIKLFKDNILKKCVKVIGGLVSKIAVTAIGSENLIPLENDSKEGLGIFYEQSNVTEFGKNNITNNFYYYKKPSTGYYIGNIYFNKYKKAEDKRANKSVDFGEELNYLINKKPEKIGADWSYIENEKYVNNSVAFSCDFISIDFLLDKRKGDNQKIIAIADLAYDSKKNFMFTGILGNIKQENKEKLQALLYGIDFNLYKIDSYLRKSNTTGLIEYLKIKLRYTKEKQELLLDLLVANKIIKSYIKDLINDEKNPSYTFDNILKYYVERLYNWRQVGSLYYSNTIPHAVDLEEIVKLRTPNSEIIVNYSDFIQKDMLKKYRIREMKYWKLEIQEAKLENKNFLIKIVLFIFTPALCLLYIIEHALKPFNKSIEKISLPIEATLWSVIRRPVLIYFLTSLFILLEVISSLFHIFGEHDINISTVGIHIDKTLVVPGSDTYHYTITKLIPIGYYLFIFFIFYIVTVFLFIRGLLILKQDSKYFYRKDGY